MRIYLAGPDVFRPDARAWAAAAHALFAAHGQQALIPIDGSATTASGIYHANLAMIRSADAVLANLNDFRGHEPDSGTCFEVGFAAARGLPVIAYLDDGRSLKDKLGQAASAAPVDAMGLQIEDFDLPLNLMLAMASRIVVGDLEAALSALLAL